MKKVTIAFLMFQFVLTAFSQDEKPAELFYELHGIYSRSVSQADLRAATTLSEINEDYPASWVKEYKSVELIATCNGKLKNAAGKSGTLNQAQVDLIKTADYGTEVTVTVKYIPDNNFSENEVKEMDFTMSLLPAVEAEYPGGADKMMDFLKVNVADQIPESIVIRDIKFSAIRFTVDTEGTITNVKAIGTSKYKDIDQLMMDAICKMPKWIPAKDSDDVKVEQEFEFVLGNTNAMCEINFFFTNHNN